MTTTSNPTGTFTADRGAGQIDDVWAGTMRRQSAGAEKSASMHEFSSAGTISCRQQADSLMES